MYLISACVGYHYKGQKSQGILIDFLPQNGWLRLAALFLFVHMLVTYLIKANVLSRAVHRAVSPKLINDRTLRGRTEWFFCTIAVLVSCIIVANTIPFFDSLTGLIGALLVPVAGWNLPVVYYYLTEEVSKIPQSEKMLLAFIFSLGVILTVTGTYSNFSDIVDSWQTYGAPWTCIYLGHGGN